MRAFDMPCPYRRSLAVRGPGGAGKGGKRTLWNRSRPCNGRLARVRGPDQDMPLAAAESLIVPSAARSASPTGRSSDSSVRPLTRAPPPRINRRAAAFESHRPAIRKSRNAATPAASSARSTATDGRASPCPPSSKVRRAVSAASSAASAPWQRVVAASARVFFASLTSRPSAPRAARSPPGEDR